MQIDFARAGRKLLHIFAVQVALCSCFVGTSKAQGGGGIDPTGTGGRHTISGRIYFPSGRRADVRAKVKLTTIQYREMMVLADVNGSFSFRSLAPGSYTIVVEGDEDYETASETVFIDGDGSSPRSAVRLPNLARTYQVQIYLQPKRVTLVKKPGVVNAELAAVPEHARTLYEKAINQAQAGETEKAIDQLKQVVSAYPQFALALNELGVQYLKVGQSAKAAEVLSSAVKLNPQAFTPRLNYGIALLERKDFPEAEAQLREAAKKNDGAATVHLYLGIALVSLRNYEEAEKELRRAVELGGNSIGLAHYYLGGIYWHKKQYKLAADELEYYLKLSPNAADTNRVQGTIKELRRKS